MYNFKNILVVRTDRMGDVILTVPAMRALRKTFPLAKIALWIDKSTKEIVDELPFIDEIILEDKTCGWLGYFRHIAFLKRKKFDLAVVFHTKKRTNAACFLAGIPYRLGYKNNKFGFLLNRPVVDKRHLGKKHEAEYCIDLLRDIGVNSEDLRLQIARHKEADIWAGHFFIEHNLSGRPVIAIHPSASCPTRFWPVDFYADLTSRLIQESKATVIIVGNHLVQPAASKIIAHAGSQAIDATGQTSLSQLISLLSLCRALISNDSGPAHLAAALGIPVISLFLRSQPGINPLRWRPLGINSVLIQNKKGEEIILDSNGKIINGRFDSITVDEVFLKVQPFVL